MENNTIEKNSKPLPIKINNLAEDIRKWVKEAEKRIFSLAAGNRVAKIAPEIMKIGLGKILYAANNLGADIEKNKPFVIFAPDGTCTYNLLRIQRCFTYGCLIKADFDGLIATHNAMPNGCGYSIFELKEAPNNGDLKEYGKKIRSEITEEQARELGKGNHFIGMYYVKDATSGEDTGRRFVLLHCSGHEIDKEKLYHTEWLKEYDGYHKIITPHGHISLLQKWSIMKVESVP